MANRKIYDLNAIVSSFFLKTFQILLLGFVGSSSTDNIHTVDF